MVPTIPYAPTPAVVPGPEPGTVFRTWSGPVRAWMTLLALAMTVLLAFLTLVAVGTVVLDASRATGECVITRSYPLLGVHKETHPLACLMLLGLPLLAWYLVVVWQRAILRVEDWRGAVVLVRTRWPLAPWTRTFPREQVLSARVAENARRRQRSYRVELVLALGSPMPLLSPWGGDPGR